jgi:hypothetical protein
MPRSQPDSQLALRQASLRDADRVAGTFPALKGWAKLKRRYATNRLLWSWEVTTSAALQTFGSSGAGTSLRDEQDGSVRSQGGRFNSFTASTWRLCLSLPNARVIRYEAYRADLQVGGEPGAAFVAVC